MTEPTPRFAELEQFAWADNAELKRRVTAFEATVPDYQAVLAGCLWRMTSHMEAGFRCAKNAPRLGYYLAQNLGTYQAILAAAPTRSLAMLISLDRQLECLAALSLPHEAMYSIECDPTPSPIELAAASRLEFLLSWNDD